MSAGDASVMSELLGDGIIHCVRYAEDDAAICGADGMRPAMDLFTGAWQNWRVRYPEQEACPECDSMWKPIALEIVRASGAANREAGILPRTKAPLW